MTRAQLESARRFIGIVGLAALVPTALMLIEGALEPGEAAIRAGVTLVGVIFLQKMVGWGALKLARISAAAQLTAARRDPTGPGSPARRPRRY